MINLPKPGSADEVREAARAIELAERANGFRDGVDAPIGLLINIESPRALRIAHDLAGAHPRVVGLQIGLAAIRVMQLTRRVLGDGIDGQVPAQQILLEGHLGGGVTGKTGITVPLFAFDARQGVLLPTPGVQEDGKVPADRLVPLRQQLLGAGAHHHIVTLPHR